MKTKKCENCGTKNPLNAEFCSECGNNLPKKSDQERGNFINRSFANWNKKSRRFKITTGLLACCIGAFIIIMILAAIFPTTSLALDNTNIDIDNQTTEYLLKGKTEPGSTVKISSTALNLNNVEIKLAADGNFEYKLQIPTNIKEAEVTVTAKAPEKSQNQASATIKRPTPETTTTKPNNYLTKSFDNKFISFKYPDSWTTDDRSYGENVNVLLIPKDTDMLNTENANLVIQLWDLGPTNKTADEEINEYINTFSSESPDFKIVKQENLTISGKTALMLIYKDTDPEDPNGPVFTYGITYLIFNGHKYSFKLEPRHSHDVTEQSLTDYQEIIKTIKIKS